MTRNGLVNELKKLMTISLLRPEVEEENLTTMHRLLGEYLATKRAATQGQNRMERHGMNRAQ